MTKIDADLIFLGKSGQIFGPFNSVELDELSTQGTLSHYHWIWDWKASAWKSIESPPPPPQKTQVAPTDAQGLNWNQVHAIGFDSGHLILGQLKWITQTGCTLISQQKQEGSLFPIRGKIRLNLYDPSSLRGATISVVLKKVNFEDHHWNYHLKWKEIPKLNKIF
jgi:hypothetical protein